MLNVALAGWAIQAPVQPQSFITSTYGPSILPSPAIGHDAPALTLSSKANGVVEPLDAVEYATLQVSSDQPSISPATLQTGYSPFRHFFALLEWIASLVDSPKMGGRILSETSRKACGSASSFWTSDASDFQAWSHGEIPLYVMDHAPLIHLYSEEQYWPCDIAEHLQHVSAYVEYSPLQTETGHRNLTNLNELDDYNVPIFLTSDDDVEGHPAWLGGEANIPRLHGPKKGQGGRSDAPVPLVVVEKGDGIVDAFWFFFYSFNLGNKVLNVRYGNHVGDWEHTVVRFKDGKPIQVFFSEHWLGQAFTYEAVQKIGKRPVGYSARGTHAMYATPGMHKYVLPFGVLHDITDRGPLWDPLLNSYSYTYDLDSETLRSSNFTPQAPIEWFYFGGRWGDKAYRKSDKRQYERFGQRHYEDGPLGPRFKDLGRSYICQGQYGCKIRKSLEAGSIGNDEISTQESSLGDVWATGLQP